MTAPTTRFWRSGASRTSASRRRSSTPSPPARSSPSARAIMGAMPIIPKRAGGDAALAPPPASADIPADAPVVSPRHYGRMLGALALAAFCVWVVYTLANGAIDWGTVPGYFVDHRII